MIKRKPQCDKNLNGSFAPKRFLLLRSPRPTHEIFFSPFLGVYGLFSCLAREAGSLFKGLKFLFFRAFALLRSPLYCYSLYRYRVLLTRSAPRLPKRMGYFPASVPEGVASPSSPLSTSPSALSASSAAAG